MKKILIVLFVTLSSVFSFSQQSLEGVVVTNLQLRAQDWAWLAGHYNPSDSVGFRVIRKIRAAVAAANPATWTAQVTVDSLPASVVVWMYATYNDAPVGMIENLGTNISTRIKAIPSAPVQYHVGIIDGRRSEDYLRLREKGKNILLDN